MCQEEISLIYYMATNQTFHYFYFLGDLVYCGQIFKKHTQPGQGLVRDVGMPSSTSGYDEKGAWQIVWWAGMRARVTSDIT